MTDRLVSSANDLSRIRVHVSGAVQGVGFRPYIYRLATELGLNGWVFNSTKGVTVDVEGAAEDIAKFRSRLQPEAPPRSQIHEISVLALEPAGYPDFHIRDSNLSGDKSAVVLPDLATCPDCLHEILDPHNRRFEYPFTNCTNCGPRFTITEAVPYDRPNTTMKDFPMCPECEAEYNNPLDRRFHAQPNACPVCGPRVQFCDPDGQVHANHTWAFLAAANAIRCGLIVAIKGIGGYQLVVDARREEAVERLRQRKQRKAKPFAVMFPNIGLIKHYCMISELEEHLLLSPEAPIVLLKQRPCVTASPLAKSVAPDNPCLGAMVAYSPLHHLLMRELRIPLVCTSGNLSDEPICIDDDEALERLGGIADAFLVHNRPIARHADDSVVRVVAGRPMIIRRARGYAPMPLHLDKEVPDMVAVGGHLKNTIAVSHGRNVFTSQHIGDLETEESYNAFRTAICDFEELYDLKPEVVACDAHPDYASTHFAERHDIPVVRVQHHYAHVLSCMADNGIEGPVLGVAWDGTGFGPDGTIWGGEFLSVNGNGYDRFAHLRPFRLPGGERAVKEPWRIAVGLLYEIYGEDVVHENGTPVLARSKMQQVELITRLLRRKLNSPVTSSAGRLFDGVAALVGICTATEYEGQAAAELEYAISSDLHPEYYNFPIIEPRQPGDPRIICWEKAIKDIIADYVARVPIGSISARFHNGLARAVVSVVQAANIQQVVLTGGCFQNKYLAEHTITLLRQAGFSPHWHQHIPPNDNGIALGQIMAAARVRRGKAS